jgi:hypothetical protein
MRDEIFRKGPVVTPVRFAAAMVLIVLSTMIAQAQEPVIHRSSVAAGEAAPTGGSFSVVFPVAFTDAEIRTEDPPAPTLVTHLLTGHGSDGLRVSAMEMSGPKVIPPIDDVMDSAKARSGAIVSEINHTQTDDMATLSFALTEPKGGSYFKVIRANGTQYMLVIQFPETIRDKVVAMKDGYFGSFKITHP